MVEVILCVREPAKLKIDYFLDFDLPQIPSVGDYISLTTADMRAPLSHDFIVRHIWWRLKHPGVAEAKGSMTDVFVECDIALGPHASPEWLGQADVARARGAIVVEFEVART